MRYFMQIKCFGGKKDLKFQINTIFVPDGFKNRTTVLKPKLEWDGKEP